MVLSGVPRHWRFPPASGGHPPGFYTLRGGYCLAPEAPQNGEWRRGRRYFWPFRTRVGFGPATGPTFKTALCHIRALVGRMINNPGFKKKTIALPWLISSDSWWRRKAPTSEAKIDTGNPTFDFPKEDVNFVTIYVSANTTGFQIEQSKRPAYFLRLAFSTLIVEECGAVANVISGRSWKFFITLEKSMNL